ncbi:winged helix-turn-helix domain-containing protein [Thalassomonas viridans]|uniref:Winged helix-turn-helix domain-containing protein n=1 Tax=Thalassomonas viridans TaxID=137584 RepID=A0AAF0C9D6_9GAMM|nr:winged helix-turn-helix domain-containing protein [Thalassomonas viridans]WDE07392.1 winged helix-turn-helix domain-containing protein [Thalassomonas viridans]
MRYFHFQDHSLDTRAMVIYRGQKKLELEPKVFELLSYFCQNPDRVISKDELMDNVWSGTLVSDNAISRTIAKVRKALNDDSKNPLYIVTVARKGYRFAASVTPGETLTREALAQETLTQENQAPHSPQDIAGHLPANTDGPREEQAADTVPALAATASAQKNKNALTLAAGLVLVTGLVILNHLKPLNLWGETADAGKTARLKSVNAITRDKGTEWHPNISKDLTRLAHTERSEDGKRNQVVLTDLSSGERRYIKHGKGNISRPVWSPDGRSLAVLWKHQNICKILQVRLDETQDLKKARTLRDCFQSAWPVFQFSPDGRFLYFNDKPRDLLGYQIFRLDIDSGEQVTLNQPITGGEGNYYFDLAPSGDKLVMLNLEYSPRSRIYTLDLAAQQLNRTAELDYRLRSVVWHHDGQTLVHPSPHPATALWHSRVDGDFLGVIASGSQRLKNLRRHPNQKDYLFSAYTTDYDLAISRLNPADENGQEKRLWQPDNSSVRDYLPALSHSGQQLAFVSKRSGSAEIWLQDKKTKTAAPLSRFNNATRIFDLLWSPDDSRLLVLADNLLYLIDVREGNMRELSASDTFNNRAIAALSWRDNERLLFSSQRNNSWQLMSYDIGRDKISVSDYRWQAGRYSPDSNSYYLSDKASGRWYRAQAPESEDITLVAAACGAAITGRTLNLKAQTDSLYCLSNAGEQAGIYRYKNNTFELLQATQKNISYDIQDNTLVYVYLVSQSADIMQTRDN